MEVGANTWQDRERDLHHCLKVRLNEKVAKEFDLRTSHLNALGTIRIPKTRLRGISECLDTISGC